MQLPVDVTYKIKNTETVKVSKLKEDFEQLHYSRFQEDGFGNNPLRDRSKNIFVKILIKIEKDLLIFLANDWGSTPWNLGPSKNPSIGPELHFIVEFFKNFLAKICGFFSHFRVMLCNLLHIHEIGCIYA